MMYSYQQLFADARTGWQNSRIWYFSQYFGIFDTLLKEWCTQKLKNSVTVCSTPCRWKAGVKCCCPHNISGASQQINDATICYTTKVDGDLLKNGRNTKRGIKWLHKHFPDIIQISRSSEIPKRRYFTPLFRAEIFSEMLSIGYKQRLQQSNAFH